MFGVRKQKNKEAVMEERRDGENLMNRKRDICENLANQYLLSEYEKQKYLTDNAGSYLFSHLPKNVGSILRESFLAGLSAEKVSNWQIVADYFQKNSEIIPALIKNAGTFEMLERMYHAQEVLGDIDHYFLLSKAGGQALYNRYQSIEREVAPIMLSLAQNNNHCLAVDFGSGPGRNMIDIMSNNPSFNDAITIDCIDNDELALAKGAKLAAEKEIYNINFFLVDMFKLKSRYKQNVNFSLLIGVVCGMSYEWRVLLFKKIRQYSKKEAKIVVAGLLDTMAKEDLLCSYILRELAGWHLEFRPFGELKQALEDAGWKFQSCFQDEPTKFYEIDIAVAV